MGAAAVATDLPAGFTLDDHPPDLPAGFSLDPTTPAPKPGLVARAVTAIPRSISGLQEGLAHTATGMAAAPLSGFAALAGSLLPGPQGQGADWQQRVANLFTYQPKSPEGEASARVLTAPGRWLGAAGNRVGEAVTDQLSSDLEPILGDQQSHEANAAAGAAANAGIQGIVAALFPEVAGRAVAGAQRGAGAVADALEASRAAKRSALTPEQLQEAETLQRLKERGLKLLPTATDPSIANQALESVAGKIKTAQKISEANAPVITNMAKEHAGVAADDLLSPEALEARRAELAAPFEQVRGAGTVPVDDALIAAARGVTSRQANAAKSFEGVASPLDAEISAITNPKLQAENGAPAFDASSAVDQIALLRAKADAQFRSPSGDRTLGTGYRALANALEDRLGRHLEETQADPALIDAFRQARQDIAKTYDVGSALDSNGNVSAAAIARRGAKKPLSGPAADIASLYDTQKKAAQRPRDIGGVSAFSPLDAFVAILGHGAKEAALLGARPAARSLLTSDWWQQHMVNPRTYAQPGMIESIARSLAGEQGGPRSNVIKSGPFDVGTQGDASAVAPREPLANPAHVIADQLQLGREPQPVGNEIDIDPFLRDRRLARAGAVEGAERAETARQADEAHALSYDPVPGDYTYMGRAPLAISEIAKRLTTGEPEPYVGGIDMPGAPPSTAGVERAIADEAIRRSGAVPQLVIPILRDLEPGAPRAPIKKTFDARGGR